jgi:hypothetical protein
MMTRPDLLDTAHIHDNPEHWDALAARVATAVARASRRGGFNWLANSRAGWVVVCILMVTVLTLSMLPVEPSAQTSERAPWAEMLAPSDEVGRAIAVLDDPPPIGALLLNWTRERRR